MKDVSVGDAVFGFLAGVGLDELLRRASIAYPALQQPTPIKLPGYDPAGLHADDLIALLTSVGVAISGAALNDDKLMVKGIMMAVGSYIQSTVIAERWK